MLSSSWCREKFIGKFCTSSCISSGSAALFAAAAMATRHEVLPVMKTSHRYLTAEQINNNIAASFEEYRWLSDRIESVKSNAIPGKIAHVLRQDQTVEVMSATKEAEQKVLQKKFE